MHLRTAVLIVGILFLSRAAAAQAGLPAVAATQTQAGLPAAAATQTQTLSERLAAMLPLKDGSIAGDRLIFGSAGAVFVLMVMNFTSGGMVAALFGMGSSNVPTSSLAAFAAYEVTYHGTVWGLGPATVLSVGQPVDAALRDGYTTPSTLAAAFAESGRRAEALALRAGSAVDATVRGWWERF